MGAESMPAQPGGWFAQGAVYEPYVGRWSRLVAREFLAWLGAPTRARWLDAGCGTGALSAAILTEADPVAVTGIDPSEGFIAYAREQVRDARASFAVGSAMALPDADGAFDAAVSGLVLNFVPEPATMMAEMARVTRHGGTVALYVWDYAGRMEMMRHFWDAARELAPPGTVPDEGLRFTLCQPEPLRDLFMSAGLADVEVRPIDIPTIFRDFDDYWSPFLAGGAPAPQYVVALDEEHRAALRDHLREQLPTGPDGSISLIARAWAVRGRR